MRLWVFSDLHLSDPQEFLYRSFLKALDEPSLASDIVVFAGDIFDLFVGNSANFTVKNKVFFEKIKVLSSKKVQLFYIEGNHDFHLSSVLSPCGVIIANDEVNLIDPLNGKKIYIAHGDLVDQTDHGYLRLRKIFRSPIIKTAILLSPGAVIEWVAERLSRPPSQQTDELPEKWPPDQREKLRKHFRQFASDKALKKKDADLVILGHCHDLDEVAPYYWNMGYPPVHRQFLYYESEKNGAERRDFPRIS